MEPATFAVASIATVYSPFVSPFGCPRQGSVCPSTRGRIDLKEWLVKGKSGYLDGLEHYSHLWVLFFFDKKNNQCSFDENTAFLNPTVRAPRALKCRSSFSAPKQFGVFATRSPHRPNPIGQTVVRIDRVDRAQNRIFVSGIDICDQTQVCDLKPYHFADAAPLFRGIVSGVTTTMDGSTVEAASGFEHLDPEILRPGDGCRFPPWVAANMNPWKVKWADGTLDTLNSMDVRFYPDERDACLEDTAETASAATSSITNSSPCSRYRKLLQRTVEEIVATDVRTAELKDPHRVWGFHFDTLNIRFRQMDEETFEVICVEKI